MITTLLLIVHIFICLFLVLVVLLQSSKGGGLAGAFGGGGGGTVFGGRETATFLEKATRYLAVAFMVSSFVLAFSKSASDRGEVESAIQRAAQQSQGFVSPQDQQSLDDFLKTVPEGGTDQEGGEGSAPAPSEDAPGGDASDGGR